MKQLYKYTRVILLMSIFSYCLSSQFYLNSFGQHASAAKDAATKDTQTKEKNKSKPKEKEKAKVIAKKVEKTKDKGKPPEKITGFNANTHWWDAARLGAKLIHEAKYAQAESIYNHILPQVRKEDPDSLNLAICLENYGTTLIYEDKCAQSIPYFDEAIKIINKQPAGFYQERNMFQILGAKAIALRNLHRFKRAEDEARRAIAFAIAFPNIAPPADISKSYVLLQSILESQNKIDEANLVSEIASDIH